MRQGRHISVIYGACLGLLQSVIARPSHVYIPSNAVHPPASEPRSLPKTNDAIFARGLCLAHTDVIRLRFARMLTAPL